MGIHLLPPEIASQIAAGEVVGRPASVVKELVENALDARARNILIESEDGGQRKITVADDGDGIEPEEIALAIERHATSKLTAITDLNSLRTLGFRGEALASIAAVARVTLTSRARSQSNGLRLTAEGGRTKPPVPVGAPLGTVVVVEDLFFNVPARRKFLKSPLSERRLMDSLVSRYALAYPQVRFRLIQEGRETFASSGNGNRREVLAAVFGLEEAGRMIEITEAAIEDAVKVGGFLSPPDLSRSHRRDILLYVNGRSISDPALTTAVIQTYHTLLMVGRYPLAAIFVDLPPEEVDVNVHPAKSEVRFRSPDAVFSGVQRAARHTLRGSLPVPGIGTNLTWGGSQTAAPGPEWMLDHEPSATPAPAVDGLPLAQTVAGGVESIPLLRVIGQIGAAYLVAEGPDGLYLIDQHAAHERVLFEAMQREPSGDRISQQLLSPAVVDLPAAQAAVLADQLDLLRHIGFEVEHFGGSSFRVQSVPQLLAGLSPAEAMRAAVEDFEEDEAPLRAEAEARLIARICKRAAVKAGRVLAAEEQEALVRALEQCRSPRTCPHGRPTMIHLPMNLLESRFGRK